MSDWPLLSLVIFLPLAGAGFILLIRGEEEVVAQNARSVALWTAGITFLLSLLIWGTFDPARADFQLVEKVEWFAGFDINYHVGIDGISLFLVLLSTLITLVCVVVSWQSIQYRVKEYMVAFLVMETFMVGVFCALDFVLFYLFFEGILIPMFLIIGVWGGPRRIYSAFKFFLYTLAGSVLFLVAILVMYLQAGTTDIPTMMTYELRSDPAEVAVARDVRVLRGQGADVAVPHLAAGRPRRGADRGLGRAGGRAAEARRLRLSALLAADAARRLLVLHAPDLRALDGGEPYKVEVLRWIHSGTFEADWVLRVDVLSAVMMFTVSTVSAIIHVYSIGYMAHDPGIPRFMSYLSLFTFFMLALVTADNFLQLYFGWEGVGPRLLPADRLLVHAALGLRRRDQGVPGQPGRRLRLRARHRRDLPRVRFGRVRRRVRRAPREFVDTEIVFLGMSVDTLTVICILLFIGAMGKSAQLGLHTWLPDAMEGPTPVSALIHAATMVTAGVFLVARCSPLFELSTTALGFVTFIGASTAIFAATVGLVQNDIKRVIAYSTCSQLGYMFFACGVSAYAAGIFHLYTHAFFKALLFLGAGSVIHAMSDEQDMRKMGGHLAQGPDHLRGDVDRLAGARRASRSSPATTPRT